MLNIGLNKHVLALFVAPYLSAIIPEIRQTIILFCIGAFDVTDNHVWTAGTFFIIHHIWVVSYVDVDILQKLICVCVVVWLFAVKYILHYEYTVDEKCFLQIYSDYHFVTKRRQLIVRCLVARLKRCLVPIKV